MSADIYWIKEVPCGRLAILGRPRAGEWLHDEITDWAAKGLTDVVSLNERSVGIHCRASIGRAGMVAVGTLLRFDVAEDVAWQYASMARGRQVPDTDEQRLWVSKAFRRFSITSSPHGPSI